MVAAEDAQVAAWLDGVKRGYGARFAASFIAIGVEDVRDLETLKDVTLFEALAVELVHAGAKPVQIHQMRRALECFADPQAARIAAVARKIAGEGDTVVAESSPARWRFALRVIPFVVMAGAIGSTLRMRSNLEQEREAGGRQLRETTEQAMARSTDREAARSQNLRRAAAPSTGGNDERPVQVALETGADLREFDRRQLWTSYTMADVSALKQHLLHGYDPTTPPPHDAEGRPVQVRIQFSLNKLLNIDTAQQEITMVGWWRHYWMDSRLAWNMSEWNGIDFITFPIYNFDFGSVWSPDNLVYDSIDTTNIITPGEVSVYPSGSVFISKPQVHRFPCTMSVEDFPFDTQRCPFTVGSWSYNGFIVDILPRLTSAGPSAITVEEGVYQPHTEFKLPRASTDHYVYKYGCCPEPYPLISFHLVLERASLPYFNGIILPLILSTAAGFLAFVTNPSAGERIGLGITVILVIGVIYTVADALMPKSNVWTLISIMYIWSTAAATITLLSSILAVSLTNISSSVNQMSEARLLAIFIEVDEDASGALDANELTRAIKLTGLQDKKLEQFNNVIKDKTGGADTITFPQWFEIVQEVSVSDGLSAYHNFVVWGLVKVLLLFERKHRKATILRRAEAVRHEELHAQRRDSPGNVVAFDAPEDLKVTVDTPASPAPGTTLELDQMLEPEQEQTERVRVEDGAAAAAKAAAESSRGAKVGLHAAHKKFTATHSSMLEDPTDLIGRRLTGHLDFFLGCIVPLMYAIVCIYYLHDKGDSLAGWDASEIKTSITHHNSDTTSYY